MINDNLIKQFVRTVPDYPVKGINFYDVNSLFSSDYWGIAAERIARKAESEFHYPTHIVGIESRGFVVGSVVAHEMLRSFCMVRKKGSKYPGKLLEESYELEYGTDTLTLQEGILGHTSRVIIADDLVATGGSLMATKKLIEQTGAQVLGAITIINLKYLNPKNFDIPMVSLMEINK